MAFNFSKPAQATGTTFGGFGTSAAAAPATPSFGGFGSPAPAPAMTFGSFGTAAAPAPAPTFGSAFGAPAPAPASASGFGGTAGLLGSTAPNFGAAAAPASGFGSGFSSSFGAKPQASSGFSTFAPGPTGMTNSLGGFGGGFGAAPAATQPQQNIMEGYEGELRKFLDLRRQYAPIKLTGNDSATGFDKGENVDYSATKIPWNDDCLFRFTVYLDKSLAAKAQLNGEEALEPNAAENNPDPNNLVPRTLMGVQALKYHFQMQNKLTALMASKVSVIKDSQLESFRRKSEDLGIRIKQYQQKHNEQNGRLIRLLRDVEYLRCRNRPLEKKEIEHRAEYDKLISLKNQCLSRLGQLEQTNESYASMAAYSTQEEFLEVSDEDLDRIYDLLKEQHDGIHHLGTILQKDIRDIEIMRTGMKGAGRISA